MLVAVAVGVAVAVNVAVLVGVSVGVKVGVAVRVPVIVGVGGTEVGVGVRVCATATEEQPRTTPPMMIPLRTADQMPENFFMMPFLCLGYADFLPFVILEPSDV